MRDKIKVYVAGPISKGDQHLNCRNGIEACDKLLMKGFIPFCPFLTGFWHTIFPHHYEVWMEYDFEWLKACECVLRLPGESSGADREVKLAESIGLPVFHSIEALERFYSGCHTKTGVETRESRVTGCGVVVHE